MTHLFSRLVGAAGLDVQTYEDVEADRDATLPAIGVVVASSIAGAIGVGAVDIRSMAGLLVVMVVSWIVWVLLTLFIGGKLLPERQTKVDFGQILRTTGFSASIGLLRVLGALPVVGKLIFAIVTIWMLLTFVIAIRQALDYTSTARALAVCVLGWAIHVILFFGFVRVMV
jgi:hypothetical protein